MPKRSAASESVDSSSTALTLSSRASRSVYGASAPGSSTTTVSRASGWRTRSWCALRRPSAADATARTSSIAATSAGSATRDASGT
ncbi:Uncharacterised protein [Mycobacteroides abscessus]|nr:Uncharacterised protein [Mycobacteroides abscessus]